jgi:hypothetical protein
VEDLTNTVVGSDEDERALPTPQAVVHPDQDAQPRRVEELDVVEIHDQMLRALLDEVLKLIAELRAGEDVDLARHGHDGQIAMDTAVDSEFHERSPSSGAIKRYLSGYYPGLPR